MYSCVLQVSPSGVNLDICSQQALVTSSDPESWLRVRKIEGANRVVVVVGRGGGILQKEIETTGYCKEKSQGVKFSWET